MINGASGNTFPLSSGDIGGESSASVRLSINATSNKILIKTVNGNFVGGAARVIIYYTKN